MSIDFLKSVDLLPVIGIGLAGVGLVGAWTIKKQNLVAKTWSLPVTVIAIICFLVSIAVTF